MAIVLKKKSAKDQALLWCVHQMKKEKMIDLVLNLASHNKRLISYIRRMDAVILHYKKNCKCHANKTKIEEDFLPRDRF